MIDKPKPGINEKLGTVEQMLAWAEQIMGSRDPDFVIGDNYLRRWWVLPRNPGGNVYIHRIEKSDDDRAFHDHPWSNTSYLLAGRYFENTPEGRIERLPGDIVSRSAADKHWLEIVPGEFAITLFFTGPWERDWGFDCPNGWIPWWEFVQAEDKGAIGRGCGEQ